MPEGKERGGQTVVVEPADELDEEFLYHWSRGNTLFTAGEYEPACVALSRALRLRPDDVRVLSLMALARYRLKHFDGAAEVYATLVEASPGEPSARMNLGLALMKARRFSEAASHLTAFLQQRPEHARAMGYLGLALLEMGDPATAREWFARAGNKEGLARCEQVLASGGAPAPAGTPAAPDVTAGENPAQPEGAPAAAPQSASGDPATPQMAAPAEQRAPPPADEMEPRDGAAADALRAELPSAHGEATIGELGGSMLARFAAARMLANGGDHGAVSFDGATLTIGVSGGWYASLAGLYGARGPVEMAPTMKRYRGHDSDVPFGEGARHRFRVFGEGDLLFHAAGRRFTCLEIDRDAGYFREEVMFAFETSVEFENGRIGAWPGPDLNLVYLQGRGRFVLRTAGEIATVKVSAQEPLSVPIRAMVGWLGELAPRIVTPASPGSLDGVEASEAALVELVGEGIVLVDPEAATRAPTEVPSGRGSR